MITSPAFAGKRFAVLGLARSGQAAVAALVASGASVMAWDNREEPRAAINAAHGDAVQFGDPLVEDLTGYSGIVVSPGVPINTHPIADAARNAGIPLVGDIELFAQARSNLPQHRVVGISGTSGKSVTTALVHHILKSAALPVRMGGNIGLPILAQQPLAAGGVYVLELSSYQLDLTHSLACDVAALTNITPDHLERHNGFAAYASAKGRLFAMQRADQHAVCTAGDVETRAILAQAKASRPAAFVHVADGAALSGQDQWPSLQGPHNLQNAAVAVSIVAALGISEAQWRPALASFKGLPHRMERVAQHGGVLYVNDSKATTCATTTPALGAYSRIHWIVGGLHKDNDLADCLPNLGNVVQAYTIGEAGPRFADWLEGRVAVSRCEMLADAVRRAKANAKPGEVVMLSPACASFDQFRDFEARGDAFRQIVEALADEDRQQGEAV